MERILWVGDAVVPTGFARVTHSVLDRLCDRYEVSVLGVNHYGDPHSHKYGIFPAYLSGEPYGFRRLPSLIERLNPDVVVIFNDPWIIDAYLKSIKDSDIDQSKFKIMVYFPVDHGNLDPRYFIEYDIVDAIATYTEYGVNEFRKAVSKLQTDKVWKINVIPHGIDLDTFYKIPEKDGMSGKEQARRELYARDDLDDFLNKFVVFNGNRNSPRKRYDIFLDAFKQFAEDKDDVMVYCHCGLLDEGIDIVRYAVDYGFKEELLVTKNSKTMPGVADTTLNTIYNLADVGVNTSMGEGWGLVAFEHAATMCPQIVPNHSACGELWHDTGILIDTLDQPYIGPKLNAEFSMPETKSLVNALEYAYVDWKAGGHKLQKLAEKAYKSISREEYKWDNVADRFDEILRNIL